MDFNKDKSVYEQVINDHEFIEKVIDAYLLVKNNNKDKDFLVRYDFISQVIDEIKKLS